MVSRRELIGKGAMTGVVAGAMSLGKTESALAAVANLKAPGTGFVVSTRPGFGDVNVADFDSDAKAVQHAYDTMVTTKGMPRTLILDPSGRPFKMDAPLEIWQSQCRVTSTGGLVMEPAEGYTGTLIQSTLRKETDVGEDGVISNLFMDNILLNGKNQCLGVKLRNLQLSTIQSIHVRNTDGPALWLSDGCMENLFANLVLSDNCGNMDLPALLIEPENKTREGFEGPSPTGNITVNSTHFSGLLIHWPTNQAMRVSTGPAEVAKSRRQRKILFNGCYFHGHTRANKPLITLAEAYELAFVGTQMLPWRKDGCVIQMGEEGARWPAGIVMISHCLFGSIPGSDTVGIKCVNVEEDAPCLAVFGNSFGSTDGRLGHAVDWGPQKTKYASWGANAVKVKGQPHIGVLPKNADVTPFDTGQDNAI